MRFYYMMAWKFITLLHNAALLHNEAPQGLSVWSLHVLPVSPRVNTLTKKHAEILVSILPPPGQPGRLMEGKGTGWNNVFLPRATSNQGNSPLSGVKERLGHSCMKEAWVQVRRSPQVGGGCVEPRITLDNWHMGEKWVTKSWDKKCKKKKKKQRIKDNYQHMGT